MGLVRSNSPQQSPHTQAAYLFHIARNHPFVDGNKRTVLTAALVFLGLNHLEPAGDPIALFEFVSGVAAGGVAKAQGAFFLQQHSRSRDPSAR